MNTAIDELGREVRAGEASFGGAYTCRWCGSVAFLKAGGPRIAHFAHAPGEGLDCPLRVEGWGGAILRVWRRRPEPVPVPKCPAPVAQTPTAPRDSSTSPDSLSPALQRPANHWKISDWREEPAPQWRSARSAPPHTAPPEWVPTSRARPRDIRIRTALIVGVLFWVALLTSGALQDWSGRKHLSLAGAAAEGTSRQVASGPSKSLIPATPRMQNSRQASAVEGMLLNVPPAQDSGSETRGSTENSHPQESGHAFEQARLGATVEIQAPQPQQRTPASGPAVLRLHFRPRENPTFGMVRVNGKQIPGMESRLIEHAWLLSSGPLPPGSYEVAVWMNPTKPGRGDSERAQTEIVLEAGQTLTLLVEYSKSDKRLVLSPMP